MSDISSLWQILGVIVSLTGLVTASSVYFARKNVEKLEQSNRQLFDSMKESHNELKSNVKDLTRHIDDRIDKMQNRIDMNNKEMKDFINSEISQLRSKDHDQDRNLEKVKEQVNDVSKDLLEFRVDVSENYVKKNEVSSQSRISNQPH